MKKFYVTIGTMDGQTNVIVNAKSIDSAVNTAKNWYIKNGCSLEGKHIWIGTNPVELNIVK